MSHCQRFALRICKPDWSIYDPSELRLFGPMASNLPKNIEQLLKEATKGVDRVAAFRSYVKLLDTGYKTSEKLGGELRKQERTYNKLKEDHTFFARHRAKVDVLLRAMRETYTNSTKALRMFEELAQHYPAQYVFDVCKLGSYRLGLVQGWSFLSIQSASRIEADQNYVNVVIPAIAQVLPNHRDYVELRNSGIEERVQAELDKLNEMRRVKSEIDTGLPKWSDAMKALAEEMKAEDLALLNQQERTVQEKLAAGTVFKFANSA
ncbi:hypothetical protein [Thalassobaculum salexigens]|uniref:hypothetical protein n=1 Tax=Thalassobaculum salexigens TaxID=455360 RepID=UPI00248ED34E|nr:hypothetical protein [Thalassobaculum salexigens]